MESDFIKITGLEIYARHGVYSEEQKKGQTFSVNLNFYYDMQKAGESDSLSEAVNYAEVCQFIKKEMTEHRFDLLEAAAEHLCQSLLTEYPMCKRVELELCKPFAPIGLPFQNVSVNLSRGWHVAYLSIGSNMGDSQEILKEALTSLSSHPAMRNCRASELIKTKPYGYEDQADFLNAAVELETYLGPEELLEELHRIENEAGRVRTIHWGPRTLDLDILFYDRLIYESADLIIPHVDLENRLFVLEPMAQLAPNFRHPIIHKTMTQLLADLRGKA